MNLLLSLIILVSTIYLLWQKDERGWYIVAGEIVLGGIGGFLAIGGLSLRTLLLVTSVIIFSWQKMNPFLCKKHRISNIAKQENHCGKDRKVFNLLAHCAALIKEKQCQRIIKTNKTVIFFLSLLATSVIISVIRGYYLGNTLSLILADLIPYLFLFYYFPLKKLWYSINFKKFIKTIIIATVIGNFLLILFTFFTYSSGIFWLHDSYYQWFRDIAGGKITDLNDNFYRIVINEHLLLVPVLLSFIWGVINEPLPVPRAQNIKHSKAGKPLQQGSRVFNLLARQWKSFGFPLLSLRCVNKQKSFKLYWTLAVILLIILSINLSRIYILAFLVGLLVLFTLKNWKRWLIYSIISVVILILSFTCLHLITSQGKSLGWELFGIRIQAITRPNNDPSALSRMLILPKIWQKFTNRPVLGHGLGDTVSVYNPVLKQNIITPNFDWGYLEILVEMGLVGLIIWIVFIMYIIKRIKLNNPWSSMFVALLVINLTSPALFHVMGIILLVIILLV